MAKEITFTPATKEQSRGRMLLFGPSGSGKTFTGLLVVFGLAGAESIEECADDKWRSEIAVIDTQRGQAAKYSHRFKFSHYILEPPYHPQHYINAIKKAEQLGFTHLLIDSITHEWDGEGGVKEIVDKAKGQFGGNSQAAWSVGTPLHNKFFEAIMASGCHIVCTARAKTAWVPGEDRRGKSIFVKVGEAPMQRETAEYEFDVSLLMDMENRGTVSKTHVEQFPPGSVYEKPGIEFSKEYLAWLSDGVPAAPRTPDVPADAPTPPDATPGQPSLVDAPPVQPEPPESPPSTNEQQEQIVTQIDSLQLDFGDYSEGVSMAEQFDRKMVEWFGTHDVEELTQAQAATALQRIKATRTARAKEAGAAA